jgi:hypothetical protein
MNSLSWMIYGAGVLGNIQGVFVAAAIVSGVAIAIFIGFSAMAADIGDAPAGTWSKGVRWSWVPLVFGLVSAVIPSSSTIYLMAASEAGEAVVSSPDAKEMLTDLKSIIRKKLKEELGNP